MWIVALALRRPYTFVVMALLIVILTPIVILRTSIDIFPEINIPVISIVWQYAGMQPQEMADRFLSNTERGLTTLVNDIQHIESIALNGRAIEKIYFQPTANLQMAIAQVTATSQQMVRQLPPGTQPPVIIVYTASSVPIVQIGVSSKSVPEQDLNDLTLNFIRTPLTTVKGVAIPYPYGGKSRVIAVDLDTQSLQAHGLTPVDVVNAVDAQNLILPTGTAKIGGLEMSVRMNASTQTVAELNDLPIQTKNGTTIYVRDVANVRDGFTPQTNIVRQDGVRGTLLSIMKNSGASTLDIVKEIKERIPRIAETLPQDVEIKTLFDQSLFVRGSINGVLREAAIAACLTAAMILLFLGDWRPTIVITISIPLSICVSIILLSALGETINIMTLGGLALAVGILVDDATVEIENIERNLAMGKEMKQAILDGASQIALPAFVSTLCICIVFVPMFFLTGVAKFLFVPLAEAVSFAMLASYLLSRTLVPTMVLYIMRGHEHKAAGPKTFLGHFQRGFERGFERLRQAYRDLLGATLEHRGIFAVCFLIFCVVSFALIFFVGEDFFPSVDAGVFRLHMRARAGTRIEETARQCDEVEKFLREEIPQNELVTILDNIGQPYSSINNTYSTSGTIGTSDAEILVSLNQEHHRPTAEYVKKLREDLPLNFPGTEFFFQPADIVSQILNFGLPSAIDVQVTGKNLHGNFAIAQQIANRMRHIPGAVDVHVQQLMNDPQIELQVDRTRAKEVGLDQQDVARNLLVSLSGSFQTSPSYWLNPENGVTYSVAVETPDYRMNSVQALMNTPMGSPQAPSPQVLANLATMRPSITPAAVYHYDISPVIDVYASTQGRDLGGVARDIRDVLSQFDSKLPRGTHVILRGQVETMTSSFRGLAFGLLMAIVLVYLLIVVNFQSWLDPFIIITALPGALAGILWMLLLSHTRLSVPSMTGAIMCVGVATANSILLVSFARERMNEGLSAHQAALEAGFIRIRP
ncbi:MAG: efflux RND transporter permease subunit, partial [Acidobacteria bacterium]|nr:efflux RND transporter permease subunit [Acidobacteriota bacterium]